MPNNWRECTFGDVVKNIRTKVKDKSYTVLSAINTGVLQPSDEYFTKQVYSKSISIYIVVEKNDFAYNPARINIGSIGLNTFDFTGCVSPVYVVFRVEDGYAHYFNHYMRLNRFKEAVKSRSSGSVRQTLNFHDLGQIPIVYPSIDYARRFNDFCEFILNSQRKLHSENQTLITLRDTLLPS